MDAEIISGQDVAVTNDSVNSLTSKYTRLSTTDKARILLLTQEGLTQQEIAEDIGCSQASVSNTLATFKGREDDAVRLLLMGRIEDRIAHWDEAEKVASKRGDHRPTKERLEAAMPKLRAQTAANSGGGGGVTIQIGIQGAPLQPPDIDLSPVSVTVVSEGASK